MSEENKTVELKEEDLERVSGGNQISTDKIYQVCCIKCKYVFSETNSLSSHSLNSLKWCPICLDYVGQICVEKQS